MAYLGREVQSSNIALVARSAPGGDLRKIGQDHELLLHMLM